MVYPTRNFAGGIGANTFSVTTVSQTGVITGNKAGTAVITASYVDEDGVTVSASCTVYVTVPDGVYSIANCYSNLYLNVPGGGIGYGLNVEQDSAYTSSDTLINQLSQQWKIVYVGEGYYTIRPMHKLDTGLSYIGGKACITEIGLYNTLSDIPDKALWKIEEYYSSYFFRNKVAGDGAAMYPVGASNTADAEITVDGYSPSNSVDTWTLTEITDVASGVLLYDKIKNVSADNIKRYIAVGDTLSLDNLYVDASVYANYNLTSIRNYESIISWSSSDTSKLTRSGKNFTGVAEGEVTVTGTLSMGGTVYTVSFDVLVTPNYEGTYYIRNWETHKYMDIENQTLTNGATVNQWEFRANQTQKWTFTLLDDGYYTINWEGETTDYYLCVENDSALSGTDVVLRSGEITEGMKWRIIQNECLTYKIVPKTGEANGYVLSVDSNSETTVDGTRLIQGASSGDFGEWLLNLSDSEVHLEAQKMSSWCWAACARMMSFKYMQSQISQEAVAVKRDIELDILNPTDTAMNNANIEAAECNELEQAIEYILGYECAYGKYGAIYSEEVLISLLNTGNPITILYGKYDDSMKRNGGHYVVIKRCYLENGNYLYEILDPWEVDVGSTRTVNYDTLCYFQEGGYNWFWEGVVVYEIGDYLNTIDCQHIA